ncbi:cell wall protein IFF7 [Vespula squamosa]|uniref:Cell wall protein IFF7 n=1 Tax=Vespula squamosa TaxID=30214 RepID=A0ABD2ACQ0_VESSQ
MFNFKKILLFLYITSGLTSSANNETQTDGASEKQSSNSNNLNTSSTVIQTKIEPVISLTTITPSISTEDSKASVINLVLTEGGPVSNSLSVRSPISDQKITAKNNSTTTVKDIFVNKNVSQVMTTQKDLPVLDRKKGYLTFDQTTVNDITVEHDNDNINSSKVENIPTKVVANITQLNNTSTTIQHLLDISEKKLNDTVISTMPPMNKHKPNPKPTVTMGGGSADPNKPIPPSPTKSSPLGMPRKIDYIIPIAITIVALPILGVASFILYNRGKDCWDKRHYRRMDFLIDGMYND